MTPVINRCRGNGKVRAQRWAMNGTAVVQAGSRFGLAACAGGPSAGCFNPPQAWLQRVPCSAAGAAECAWTLDHNTGQLRDPAGDRCLTGCPGNPYPPKPHTAVMVPTCHPDSPSAKLPFCDGRLGFEARAADL